MSDPKYKNIGSPAIRVMEECAELIKAMCKGERFGWDNHHPDRPDMNNFSEAQNELFDILEAFDDFKKTI